MLNGILKSGFGSVYRPEYSGKVSSTYETGIFRKEKERPNRRIFPVIAAAKSNNSSIHEGAGRLFANERRYFRSDADLDFIRHDTASFLS